jgi:hypothetical protein
MQLFESGIDAEIIFSIDTLSRLEGYKESKLSFHFWLRKKIAHWLNDRRVIKVLKQSDAVVISECIPNAFWKKLYHVEKLKAIIKKPVFIFEVYSLGNAPTQIQLLEDNNDALLDRYDGHLFVSPVTEIKEQHLNFNAFCIGLDAKSWNLQPLVKKELLALVDFAQPGFEIYRETQISQLKKAGIPFIALENRYTIEEIRNIYRQVSIYFMQSSEAFGLPILECFCTGAQVFTPDSAWPMSWRLNENPEIHGPGILPRCFTIYKGEDDLLQKLLEFKEYFNPVETPIQVFNVFFKTYPTFYIGNSIELKRFIDFIKSYKSINY